LFITGTMLPASRGIPELVKNGPPFRCQRPSYVPSPVLAHSKLREATKVRAERVRRREDLEIAI